MSENKIQVEAPSTVVVSYKDPEAVHNAIDEYMCKFTDELGINSNSEFAVQMRGVVSEIVHKKVGEYCDVEINIVTGEVKVV